jgi:hypothetical protein
MTAVSRDGRMLGYTGSRRFVSGGKSVILEGRDSVADAWSGVCL